MARSITQVLQVVQDRDLTGSWRSDSPAGDAVCHGFMTFELGGVPAQLLETALGALEWTTWWVQLALTYWLP